MVGGPDRIPFELQYELDVQYAVGRLDFDELEAYGRYASSVVAAEEGASKRPRRATFFGAANRDDRATRRSLDHLVRPLSDTLEERRDRLVAPHDELDWAVELVAAEEATKSALAARIGGARVPAFLFCACHGLGFPAGHPEQRTDQGALLCQDWPEPGRDHHPVDREHYVAAADIDDDASVDGLIAFFFACFGAGTPRYDAFGHRTSTPAREIAPSSFVASLPQRLLSHPQGGAQAVIGHVDRSWSYGFDWPGAGQQTEVFKNMFLRLLDDYPVGAAMEYFGQRYSELAVHLWQLDRELALGGSPDRISHIGLWTAHNDARGFVVLGDPAVRLAVDRSESAGLEEPPQVPVTVSTPATASPVAPPASPPASYLDTELHLFDHASTRFSFDGRDVEATVDLGPDLEHELMRLESRPRRYGETLFERVFPPGSQTRKGFHQAQILAEHDGLRLRLRLRLGTRLPASLHALHWERLRDPGSGLDLARHPEVAFSRWVPRPKGRAQPTIEHPRVLGVVAAPSDSQRFGLDAIDRDRVATEIEVAFSQLGADLRSTPLTPPATLERIRSQMRSQRCHVLHLVGHGCVDHRNGSVHLVLEAEDGTAQAVTAEAVAEMLTGLDDLRMVVLVACDGARPSETGASLARQLVERGIPAVVAFRRGVRFDTAARFTHFFYQQLGVLGHVDAALNETRQLLHLDLPNRSSWSDPILFMGLTDGRLWIDPQSRAPIPPPPWGPWLGRLRRLAALDPSRPEELEALEAWMRAGLAEIDAAAPEDRPLTRDALARELLLPSRVSDHELAERVLLSRAVIRRHQLLIALRVEVAPEIEVDGVRFVLVPPGVSRAGSVNPRPFLLARAPLSDAAWRRSSGRSGGRQDRARVEISPRQIDDLLHFVNRRIHGARWRLPTVAELRFAAELDDPSSELWPRLVDAALETRPPSAVGLHDLTGVVHQLCEEKGQRSWWGGSFRSTRLDRESAVPGKRVVSTLERGTDCGFRPVLELDGTDFAAGSAMLPDLVQEG
ncbi:MAG: CHAT domain-containing protein [Acidobacteriota bacterium]